MAGRRVIWKINLLWFVTAIALSIARYLVQYNHYPWKGGNHKFLIAVFIHYIILGLGLIGVIAVLHVFRLREPETDPFEFSGTVIATVLVISVLVIVVYIMRGT
jgi:hypothetical protein